MARGINKVILVGNLGKDPEIRYTANGAAVANLTLATSTSRKDAQSGDWQDYTEWHRVVFFGKIAEIVGEYLRKGRQIYVEGRLQTRKWQDKNGMDRYTTEIVGNEMQMLGGKDSETTAYGASPANNSDSNSTYASPASAAPASAAPASAAPAPAPVASKPPANDFDDDIPF